MARTIKRKINANGTYEQIGYLPTQTPVEGTLNSVSVAGTAKSICKLTPEALFAPSGLVMGGTAQQAGLVTRGICGVSVPDSTGACTKDNLYVNYDGNNNYSRKLVLGAGSVGTAIGNSNGAYTYCAVRGDQMTAYVANYVSQCGFITSGEANGLFATISDLNALSTSVDTLGNKVSEIEKNLKTTSENAANNARNIQYARDEITSIKDTIADIDSFEYKVVSLPLPEPSESTMHIIYLIEHSHSDSQDAFDEYITLKTGDNSYKWEKIGNTDVDLSDYYTQEQIDSTIGNISTAISDLTEGQANNATAISKNMSAIADRYTKGEVDGKLGKMIPGVGNREFYGFWGGGKYRWCLVCKIKLVQPYQSVNLVIEYGGNGSESYNVVIIDLNVGNSLTSNYSVKCFSLANTNYKFYTYDKGNGEIEVYCDIIGEQGYFYINRIWGRIITIQQLTMLMEGVESIPDGAVSASPYLWSRYAKEAESANNATIADSYKYASGKFVVRTSFDDTNTLVKEIFGDSYPDNNHIVVMRTADPYNGDYFAQSWSSGLFWNYQDSWAGFTVGARDYGKGIKFVVGGVGNKGNPAWTLDLITSLNIANQTVKDFSSTSINHGCGFNGDLSSTSVVHSPKFNTIGILARANENAPDYEKTITGNISVRFGSAMYTINVRRNKFMEHFFAHGYHLDKETEASTFMEDCGVVSYNDILWYCVFRYYTDGHDPEFNAYPIITEKNDSNYVKTEKGEASDISIDGGTINNMTADNLTLSGSKLKSGNGSTIYFPADGGTLATQSYVSSSVSSVSNSVSSLSSRVSSLENKVTLQIKAGKCTVNEDMEYTVDVGYGHTVVSVTATAYREGSLSGSGNQNERVCVRWSGRYAYIRNDGGTITIAYSVFYN